MGQIKEQDFSEVDEILSEPYAVIVWNDDVHSFDFVIECLMMCAGHGPEQAEQCTFLIHFKGKCDVKRGDKEKMQIIYNKLFSRGLTVTLEKL
jgi:ATP-dependent Clp protease adaptor protein ClpS